MGQSTRRYYALMASLPRLVRHFEPGRLPVDRQTLYFRLKELIPADRREMEILFEHSRCLQRPLDLSDESVVALFADTLEKLQYPFTRDLIQEGLVLRLAVSVFRQRRLGRTPRVPTGSFPVLRHIRDHIEVPDLKLASRIPGIAALRETVLSGDVLATEKCLDEFRWRLAEKIGEGEFFTFKSFVSWFIRWDTLQRWSRVDWDSGFVSFENMLGGVKRYEF